MNLWFSSRKIEHFIIVTADKDFIPLVNALKALKKRVIIVGKADVVSEHLMLSAHDFVPLETLPKYLNSYQELVYVEVGMLIFQDDGCYRIIEDLEIKKRHIIDQLTKSN